MPARRSLPRAAAAAGVLLFAALGSAGPAMAHDHATTPEHTTAHEHATTPAPASMHDHSTMSPTAEPATQEATGHDHSTMSPTAEPATSEAAGADHQQGGHGTGTGSPTAGEDDPSRALVLGGFAAVNAAVVGGAAVARRSSRPAHLPRNRRS